MSAFEAWLAGLPPPTAAPKAVTAVENTPEFRRVRDAARVRWDEDPRLEVGRRWLTWHLRTLAGQQELFAIQAAILRVLYDLGRGIVPLRTGGGKTLPSFLAPELVGAKRPLLLVPAKLLNPPKGAGVKLGKTHREHAKARAHWKLRPIMSVRESRARNLRPIDPNAFAPLRVLSYEALSRAEYETALIEWAPDLVIADEAHKLKRAKAVATRRVRKYLKHAPDVRLLLLSGSFMNRAISEYAHLLRWCLGDATPLPRDWHEMRNWGWALDEKVPDAVRLEPGALLEISPPAPEDAGLTPIDTARRRYGRRLMSTEGVIASGDNLPAVGLLCRVERLEPDDAQRALVKHLRDNWETPCGLPFEFATDLWRHEQTASTFGYYRWDVQPPPEWVLARKAWSAFVRETLSHSQRYDQMAQIANAIDAGLLEDYGTLSAWRAVRDLFKPSEHQEPVWVSDNTLNHCADWLHSNDGGGICWVMHTAFGKRLSEVSGVPYFGAGAAAGGVPIDHHHGPAIASIKAVGEGFNLHEIHCRNLVSTIPTTNWQNEQMISRTHRDRSAFDEVEVIYLVTFEGDARALTQARADARAVELTQLQPQRLTAATWLDE